MNVNTPKAYTVQKDQGLWSVCHAGHFIRAFLTAAVADLYARAWNANRQPTNEELAAALSK
jgi:hypothetical protein